MRRVGWLVLVLAVVGWLSWPRVEPVVARQRPEARVVKVVEAAVDEVAAADKQQLQQGQRPGFRMASRISAGIGPILTRRTWQAAEARPLFWIPPRSVQTALAANP